MLAIVPLALSVTGCFFPDTGPSSRDIATESFASLPYGLVKITAETTDILARYEPKGLAGAFTDRRPPANIKFGVGDVVSVTIFEAAAGGLFIPTEAGVRPGNFVALPDQGVDFDGNISVPFAGIIKAAGRTNVQVQNEIVDRIKNRAIEPQVIVSLSQQRTGLVTVLGEINNPVRFAAPAAGALDRITDAITRAGGIKGQGYETWVMLERDKRRATVPFENLVMYPSNNIFLLPGDRIYVYREQQKFIAFGASGQQGEFNFDAWRINLTEAVAKAGGLVDTQADPGAIFLYRREPRDVAAQLGVDVSRFPGAAIVPVIFSVSFRDPSGYFLSTQVQMRNQDVVFVSNAAGVDAAKFLQFVNLATASVANGANATSGVAIARYNLKGGTAVTP